MNHNKHFIVQQIRFDGVHTVGIKKENTKEYAPKTSCEERKPRKPNGSKGIGNGEKKSFAGCFFYLARTHSIHSLRWITITYSEDASDEAILNIASQITKLKRKIRDILKEYYLNEWLVSIGLQYVTSKTKKLPCYDINIVVKNHGNSKEEYIIKLIYDHLSKLARERIKIPLDLYRYKFLNDESDFRKPLNYLINKQVDKDLLEQLRKIHPKECFPNGWTIIPTTLKDACKPIKSERKAKGDGCDLKQVQGMIENDLNDCLKFLPKHSNKQGLTSEFDAFKYSPEDIQKRINEVWKCQSENE